MTKAKTKGQRIRLRAGRKPKPGKREPNGQPKRPGVAERAEEATRTAVQARLARLGYPDTPEARLAAQSPLAGDPLGRCIMAMIPSRRSQDELKSVWQDISAAKQNWQQRYAGTNPNPQAAAIAMLPEPMQTDDSHSIDLRTPEERDAAAVRGWEFWLALLMELPPSDRHALRGYLDGYGLPLWRDECHAPTLSGAAAVRALVALHKMRA
jgi:hypothetical protein